MKRIFQILMMLSVGLSVTICASSGYASTEAHFNSSAANLVSTSGGSAAGSAETNMLLKQVIMQLAKLNQQQAANAQNIVLLSKEVKQQSGQIKSSVIKQSITNQGLFAKYVQLQALNHYASFYPLKSISLSVGDQALGDVSVMNLVRSQFGQTGQASQALFGQDIFQGSSDKLIRGYQLLNNTTNQVIGGVINSTSDSELKNIGFAVKSMMSEVSPSGNKLTDQNQAQLLRALFKAVVIGDYISYQNYKVAQDRNTIGLQGLMQLVQLNNTELYRLNKSYGSKG